MSDQDQTDRQDPRVRELTYRLMAMAPDAPPFPEEAPMQVPETKQRPPMLVWAATAVAAVMLIGVPLFLFRGGDEPVDPATTMAAPDTTTTTTEPDETTTAPETTTVTTQPSQVVPMTSGDCKVDWESLENRDPGTWYVFYGCDRPGMESILVPVAFEPMTSVALDIQAAMRAQLAGPTTVLSEAGYVSFSVEDPEGVVLGYEGPTDVEFDFDDFRADGGMSNASASTASMHLLAELSSAAFQFPDVETVTFAFNGSCDVFWNWLQRDCGVITRSEWAASELTRPLALWFDSSQAPPTTTTLPTTETTLPGEAFDIGPAEGDVVAIVGVAHDDVLWLRDGPGVGYEPLVGLDPLTSDLVATGRHRLLESSIWTELAADGITGWVNSSYIGYLGGVEDITSQIIPRLSGTEAETMLDLGTMVAESFDPGEGGFRYEMVVPPTVGDLGEVTFDVVGLLDDSQLGWRLHIFGQPTAGGEGFSLKSIEATAFCGRGVTEDGLCI